MEKAQFFVLITSVGRRFDGIASSFLVFMLMLLTGCATPPPPAPPVARSFTYTPPEQAKQLLPVTVALVRPTYDNPAAMAKAPSWAKMEGDAFVNSIKTDLEKILIAKGIKVTGPYDSLDIMTFPEKKGANLTLTPLVSINTDMKITNNEPGAGTMFPGHQAGIFVAGGSISLTMLEPMSGEKMWLKRIEIEPVSEPFEITYNSYVQNGRQHQNILSDTRQQALTRALNRIYPIVLQQAWTYLNAEEIMSVNKQSIEARERKRY